jgi:hypothetical protein
MNAGELETLYRRQFEDRDSRKYYLTQEEFLVILNEAEEEAAYRKNLLFDKTSSFCSIPLVAGQSVYALNDCIYAIVFASVTDSAGVITRIYPTDRLEMDRRSPTWRTDTRTPENYIQLDTSVEITPIPDAVYTLNLEVYRLPLEPMASAGDEPEIHRNSQAYLVDWVLHRLYDIPDVDTQDPKKSMYHLARFESVFGTRPDAQNQRDKYANRPHRNTAN